MDQKDNSFKVAVVGAGCSGLESALTLIKAGVEVEIFEASEFIGGRIRKCTDFAEDFQIELGAEKIHTENCEYFEYVKQLGDRVELIDEIKLKKYCQFENKIYSLDALEQIRPKEIGIFDDMRRFPSKYQKGSVEEFLLKAEMDKELFHYFHALMGVRQGGDLKEVDISNLAVGEATVPTLLKEYTLKGITHYDILCEIYKEVIPRVRLNTVIKSIDYTDPSNISLEDQNGNKYRFSQVIITSSIGVLKKGLIKFNPELEDSYQEKIRKICFGRGGKLFLKFSEPFWDCNTGFFLIKGLIPYFRSPGSGKSLKNNILSCLVHGEAYDNLVSLSSNQIIEILLNDLNSAFPGSNVRERFICMRFMDWSKEEWISGTYSFHGTEETTERTFLLNNPVDKRIYFVGEHLSEHDNGTIHGAINTGRIVAKKIISKFNGIEDK